MTSLISIKSAVFVTIDSEFTKDIDDAISIEHDETGFHILVAIADPTSFVATGSKEDRNAKDLGASVYARDHAVKKMLPPRISQNLGSLVQGAIRQSVVFSISLDNQLAVIDFKPSVQQITVSHRLSYKDIPAIADDPVHPLNDQIRLSILLSQQLLKLRRESGALAFYDMQRLLMTDEEGNLKKISSRSDTMGHIVVQEMMILTNSLAAQFMIRNDIPTMYRNHVQHLAAPPAAELMKTVSELILLSDDGRLDAMKSKLTTIWGKAKYEAVVRGHYGLNLPAYAHMTSPLRRYPDLINIRQLKAFLLGQPYDHTQQEIRSIADSVNETLSNRKEEKSGFFKSVVTTGALKMLEKGELAAMTHTQLSMAIKALKSEPLPPALEEEILSRLKNNDLSDALINRLLYEVNVTNISEKLALAFAFWTFQNCHKAVQIVGHGIQKELLSKSDTNYQKIKNDFEATIEITNISTGKSAAGRGLCRTQKEAEQFAICGALLSLFGFPVQETKLPPEELMNQPDLTQNFKGKLLEKCAKLKVEPPLFVTEKQGKSNLPEFLTIATVTINGTKINASGQKMSTKKGAEADASAKLLELMSQNIANEKKPIVKLVAKSVSENPIGNLQEIFQKAVLPAPYYSFEFNDQNALFICKVDVVIEGNSASFTGSGPNKSIAKRNAATSALESLQQEHA